jgi:zinc D-Ala-D-Ala carboxypeptidase
MWEERNIQTEELYFYPHISLKNSMIKTYFITFTAIFGFALSSCSGEYIHPDFSITKNTFEKALQSLSPADRTRIIAEPKEFLSLLEQVLEGDQKLLPFVDKTHALAADFAPPGLARLETRKLRVAKTGLMLRAEALDALAEMDRAARKENIDLVAGSTYRSYADQESVYAYWVKTLGKAQADRESAMPGHSQHQLGTTIDFSPIDDSFTGTPEASWLAENAWKYGFSISYPDGYEKLTGYKYEPWHYRYIGKNAAAIVVRYFKGIQDNFLRFYAMQGEFFSSKLRKSE